MAAGQRTRPSLSRRKRAAIAGAAIFGTLAGVAAAPLLGDARKLSSSTDWTPNGSGVTGVGNSLLGTGGDAYNPNNPNCYQSLFGIPPRVAKALHTDSASLYCAGKRTEEILREQVPKVSSRTKLIIVSAAANDYFDDNSLIQITKQIPECVNVPIIHVRDACEPKLRNPWDNGLRDPRFIGGLVSLAKALRKKAPRATIVFLGLPNPLSEADVTETCDFIRASDVNFLRDEMKALNNVIENAAKKAGVAYFDLNGVQAFNGHRACDGAANSWVNDFDGGTLYRHLYEIKGTPIHYKDGTYNAFHPKKQAYEVFADALVDAYKNGSLAKQMRSDLDLAA